MKTVALALALLSGSRSTSSSSTNHRYFFYDGKSQPESMVKSWDRVFQKIGASADPTVALIQPQRRRGTACRRA
jgi:hypothetical protein